MKAIQEAITGNENFGNRLLPYEALVHFYYAFNQKNFSEMEKNWANTDTIAMDNPLGGIKRGWVEIGQVYERIFRGPAEIYVEFYDYTIQENSDIFYAVGRERGRFQSKKESFELAIRTSRIFQKIDGQWRQVHHHGSIENPQLLERYQKAVLGVR
jgi:ketosteroid isomerase-like protein